MPFYKHCSNFCDLANYPVPCNGLPASGELLQGENTSCIWGHCWSLWTFWRRIWLAEFGSTKVQVSCVNSGMLTFVFQYGGMVCLIHVCAWCKLTEYRCRMRLWWWTRTFQIWIARVDINYLEFTIFLDRLTVIEYSMENQRLLRSYWLPEFTSSQAGLDRTDQNLPYWLHI